MLLKYIINNYYCSLLIVICSLLIVACSVENQVARETINKHTPVLLYVPVSDYLIKTDSKQDSDLQASNLTKDQKDSALIAESLFLKDIKDTVFLNNFFHNLFDELKAFGLNVYTDSNKFYNEFQAMNTERRAPGSDSFAYVFNPAQLELEEYLIPYEDEAYIDTTWFVQSFDLNAVSFNSWFVSQILTKHNALSAERSSKVLFAEHSVKDIIDGVFKQDIYKGNITYKYNREDFNLDDIYKLANYSGRKIASYIFDYILNHQIYVILKAKKVPKTIYFHYNRFKNIIYPANDDRFVLIKQ